MGCPPMSKEVKPMLKRIVSVLVIMSVVLFSIGCSSSNVVGKVYEDVGVEVSFDRSGEWSFKCNDDDFSAYRAGVCVADGYFMDLGEGNLVFDNLLKFRDLAVLLEAGEGYRILESSEGEVAYLQEVGNSLVVLDCRSGISDLREVLNRIFIRKVSESKGNDETSS